MTTMQMLTMTILKRDTLPSEKRTAAFGLGEQFKQQWRKQVKRFGKARRGGVGL